MHHINRVEVLEPLCHLVELGIESWVSERPVEFDDGDDTRRVRETCGEGLQVLDDIPRVHPVVDECKLKIGRAVAVEWQNTFMRWFFFFFKRPPPSMGSTGVVEK